MNSPLKPCALAVAVVAAFAGLSACDSIDPTAQSFAIQFRNDLGQEIELKLCSDDGCQSFDYTDTVEPGELYPENASDRGVLSRWLLGDNTGNTVGCLPLQFEEKESDVIVDMSRNVPCPGDHPLAVHGVEKLGRE